MTHYFDTDIATKYGILEAVILNHIHFWITKNEANKENIHDGRVWTYCSLQGFKDLFPYASQKQIRSALYNLKDKGVIETGCYNKLGFDRTQWYTLTDLGTSICPRGHIHLPQRAYPSAPEGTPIPDNITDNKTDNIYNMSSNIVPALTTKKTSCRSFISPTVEDVKKYCEERGNNINAENFVNYYTANGWKVGRNQMKDWKAAIRTWEQRESSRLSTPKKERDNTLDDIF